MFSALFIRQDRIRTNIHTTKSIPEESKRCRRSACMWQNDIGACKVTIFLVLVSSLSEGTLRYEPPRSVGIFSSHISNKFTFHRDLACSFRGWPLAPAEPKGMRPQGFSTYATSVMNEICSGILETSALNLIDSSHWKSLWWKELQKHTSYAAAALQHLASRLHSKADQP